MTDQTPSAEIEARLQAALEAYTHAEDVILQYYQKPELEVERKEDESPVTLADKGAEVAIRDYLATAFPDDGVLGEELDEVPSKNGYRWILDPIDGTKSFIHGVPLFGTLIGVEKNGEVVVGLCGFPGLNEVIYAATGGGAWWKKGDADPQRCAVSEVDSLSESLFCVTDFTKWGETPQVIEEMTRHARLVRGWGDCYAHMLVATGRAEVIIEPQMSIWDAAALVPIIREAGGHFVSWSGEETHTAGQLLSVNDKLKQPVLDLLNSINAPA